MAPGRPRQARRPVGRRISADELRASGVDEDFLQPAHVVSGVIQRDIGEGQRTESVLHERGNGATKFMCSSLGPEGQRDCTSVQQSSIGSASTASADFRSGNPERREQRLSRQELAAEYGFGFKMLVAMGYRGDGPTPLAPQKRVNRIGLQDNEAFAVDHSVALPKKKKRRTILMQRADSNGMDTVKAAWGGVDWGPESDADDADARDSEEEDDEDSDDGDCSILDLPLRKAILRELRQSVCRMPLVVLSRQPRVRQAFKQSRGVGEGSTRDRLRAFIRAVVPECKVSRSSGRGWSKMFNGRSAASWQDAIQKEYVVELKPAARPQPEAAQGTTLCNRENHNRAWVSSESSSEDDACATVGAQTLNYSLAATGCQDSRKDMLGWSCHGCNRIFAGRSALREHLAERMAERTTHDPTDLGARFDREHRDRVALQAVADAVVASSDSGNVTAWCCPACDWRAVPMDFAQLVEHATTEVTHRLAHRRLVLLLAELLTLEPPPSPTSFAKDSRVLRTWAAGVKGLTRLFEILAARPEEPSGRRAVEYRRIEEAALGRQEEDIFDL